MKTPLAWIGAASLVLWTGGGLVAWKLAQDHLTIVFEEGTPARAVADDPAAELVRRVDGLERGQRALAQALEHDLGVLDERAEARGQALERGLRGELETARRELAAALDLLASRGEPRLVTSGEPAGAPSAADRDGPTAANEPAPASTAAPERLASADAAESTEAADAAAATAEPAPRSGRPSFLAFDLPGDDFRFDERRAWTIDPALSRVGFDAKSTLHDFSGATSALEGSLVLVLARPGDAPRGEVRADARALITGSEGRDAQMREHLDVEHHAGITFRLLAFEPERVDEAAGIVTGTARGRMRIRGVERAFAMPVRAALDAGRRLSIEGEAPLSLPAFGVAVPSKLGLVSMRPDVVVWIALRARLEPRSGA